MASSAARRQRGAAWYRLKPRRGTKHEMTNSLLRISIGVLIAVPLVTMLTLVLLAFPPVVGVSMGIAGAGALTASRHIHNRWLAAVGGLLAFSGVLAYALRA